MMAKIKSGLKILFAVFAVLLLALFMAGCAEYKPPQTSGGPSGPTVPVKPDDPPKPDDPDERFTITLKLITTGEYVPFTKEVDRELIAQQAVWTEVDGTAVFSNYFDENGVATPKEGDKDKLDGNFKVSLLLTSSFRAKYTYDPDPIDEPGSREVSNDKKSAEIGMYRLLSIGKTLYCNGYTYPYYEMGETGAYSVTLNSRNQSVLFFFQPKISGIYTFLTFADTTADEVNPMIKLYRGILPHTPFYENYYEGVYDDGGAAGRFTKNVRFDYDIADNEIGGNGLMFLLYSNSISGDKSYPLQVDFIFKREGEFATREDDDYSNAQVVNRTDMSSHTETPEGEFKFFVYHPSVKNRVLDQKKVAPNPADNNYYYFVDENGNFTDKLYAVLAQGNEVMDTGFNNPDVRLYYLTEKKGKPAYNYQEFMLGATGYLTSGCLNSDGAFPVNEELKLFLQRYAVSERLFYDGFGFAEMSGVDEDGNPNPDYDSDEESQWLYACGYYAN